MTKLSIISDPRILRGKPIIAGTRISVELIMDLLGAGLCLDDIIREYPHLTKEAVKEAVNFAKARLQREEIYPLTSQNGKVVFAT